MCGYLLRIGAAGVVAGCLAVTAMADPPVNKYQNRWFGNSVYAESCDEVENGSFCRKLDASERYDLKGMLEYVEATIQSWRSEYDPSDGSSVYGWRYLSCPVDRDAISVDVHGATFEATLDPQAVGCYSAGYLDSWDPVNGYQTVPWSYPGPMAVKGEWADPFSYSRSVVNEKGMNYDGWSGITSKYGQNCNGRSGELMQSGGFSIGARSWEFLGPEGAAWSSYDLISCNDRITQR